MGDKMNFIILENIGDNFCEEPNVLGAVRIIGYLLLLLKLFVPIIIIGFGIFDMYKSIVASGSDSFSKQLKSLMNRIIIGIFIFFVPTLINLILNQLDNYTWKIKSCQRCLLEPFDCKIKAKAEEEE